MPKSNMLSADYIVHYVGYSAYIIGKQNDIDAICSIYDGMQCYVHIEHRDAPGFDVVVGVAGRIVHDLQIPHCISYLNSLYDDGPIPIDIHGVGLIRRGRLTFYPLKQAFDGRHFRRLKPRSNITTSKSGEPEELARLRSRFAINKTMLTEYWDPKVALGAECLQMECRAVVSARRIVLARQRRYPDLIRPCAA